MSVTNQEPPIADPVVTIDGRAYAVGYTLRAQFKLSEWGIDPNALSCLATRSPDPKRVYYALQAWAAMTAHNFGPGEVALTAEEWADRIDQDSDDFKRICEAVGEALGKRIRTMAAKRQPAPVTATAEASSSAVQ